MRYPFSLLLLGAMLHVSAAGPEVTPIPAPDATAWSELRVSAGKLVVYGAAPASTWDFVDDTFAARVFEGGKLCAFVFPEGRHKVMVTGPDGAKTRLVFVAGNAPPEPKPVPIDSLVKELAELYAAETSASKKADMQSLSALYTLMVAEAGNATYTSAAQLNATFIDARDRMLSDGKTPARLPTIRKRCGQEVQATIGDNPDATLTEASRKAVAAVYARLAQAVAEAAK